MIYIEKFFLLYCVASCVACPIHMWRNRKDKNAVMLYAYTWMLCALGVIVFSR